MTGPLGHGSFRHTWLTEVRRICYQSFVSWDFSPGVDTTAFVFPGLREVSEDCPLDLDVQICFRVSFLLGGSLGYSR